MSFGGNKPSGSGFAFKQFESADEVEEKKKKRQEEWEQVRQPDEPLECPEGDSRSLFDQLQDQKMAKQEEWDEQQRFRNSVKGLEDDEVGFLEEVSDRQVEIEKAIRSEEKSVLQELKNASVTKLPDEKKTDKPASSKSQPLAAASSSKKSQQTLLAGAVKRKSTEDHGDTKHVKLDNASSPDSSPPRQVARVIGILPGIGFYDDHSSDSDSTSSDSSIEFSQPIKIKKIIVQQADG